MGRRPKGTTPKSIDMAYYTNYSVAALAICSVCCVHKYLVFTRLNCTINFNPIPPRVLRQARKVNRK